LGLGRVEPPFNQVQQTVDCDPRVEQVDLFVSQPHMAHGRRRGFETPSLLHHSYPTCGASIETDPPSPLLLEMQHAPKACACRLQQSDPGGETPEHHTGKQGVDDFLLIHSRANRSPNNNNPLKPITRRPTTLSCWEALSAIDQVMGIWIVR